MRGSAVATIVWSRAARKKPSISPNRTVIVSRCENRGAEAWAVGDRAVESGGAIVPIYKQKRPFCRVHRTCLGCAGIAHPGRVEQTPRSRVIPHMFYDRAAD